MIVLGVNEDEDEGEGANEAYPLIAWAGVSGAIGVCHYFSFANLSIGCSTLSPGPLQSFGERHRRALETGAPIDLPVIPEVAAQPKLSGILQ